MGETQWGSKEKAQSLLLKADEEGKDPGIGGTQP